jgi:CheY-like chemotaxis protein
MKDAYDRPTPSGVHLSSGAPAPRTPRTGRVLLVDDDPSIRELVSDVLTQNGYAVAAAVNGAAALALLDRDAHPPDVILLDRFMPMMDGDQFACALRRLGSVAPIIAFTGTVEGEDWAAQIQAVGFVAKPFELAQLLAAVARFCPPGMTPRAPRPKRQTAMSSGWPSGRMAG